MSNAERKKFYLIVEDDESSRKLLEYYLTKLDVDILSTSTAEEALDVINNGRNIDCMFFDIMLSREGMTGVQLVKEVRRINRFKNTPVIAVTSLSAERAKFIEVGFNEYLRKPYTINDLTSKLENSHALYVA